MTFSTLADDIILRIYSGNPSDDIQLEKSQVIHWLTIYRDSIVSEYLNKLIQAGKAIDTNVISQLTGLIAAQEVIVGDDDCNDKFYITLTKEPLSLINDMGVYHIEDEEGLEIGKTRTEMRSLMRNLRYARPTINNLNWYRIGTKVYIEGLTEDSFEEKQFTVLYIPSQQNALASDTVQIGADMLAMLADTVEEVARRQMLESKIDSMNNGVEDDETKK